MTSRTYMTCHRQAITKSQTIGGKYMSDSQSIT